MSKFKDLPLSARHYFIAFWITITIALGLLVTGFFLPPRAEISGSVLEAAGLIFLWPALAFANKALEEGHTATISHNNTTIEIKKDEDGEPVAEIEEGEIE